MVRGDASWDQQSGCPIGTCKPYAEGGSGVEGRQLCPMEAGTALEAIHGSAHGPGSPKCSR